MSANVVTYKVEQNEKFGDFRVHKYLNGEWWNERDGNWSKGKAQSVAKEYRATTAKGLPTMGDNF